MASWIYLCATASILRRTQQNNVLYRNNGNTNHWLKLALVGTVSNRSAIGAKVRVKTTSRGKTFWQLREILVVRIVTASRTCGLTSASATRRCGPRAHRMALGNRAGIAQRRGETIPDRDRARRGSRRWEQVSFASNRGRGWLSRCRRPPIWTNGRRLTTVTNLHRHAGVHGSQHGKSFARASTERCFGN